MGWADVVGCYLGLLIVGYTLGRNAPDALAWVLGESDQSC